MGGGSKQGWRRAAGLGYAVQCYAGGGGGIAITELHSEFVQVYVHHNRHRHNNHFNANPLPPLLTTHLSAQPHTTTKNCRYPSAPAHTPSHSRSESRSAVSQLQPHPHSFSPPLHPAATPPWDARAGWAVARSSQAVADSDVPQTRRAVAAEAYSRGRGGHRKPARFRPAPAAAAAGASTRGISVARSAVCGHTTPPPPLPPSPRIAKAFRDARCTHSWWS
ncbi:hypothetical protein FN846DRAFT_201710 [Sphaerosporella brunnea]|uniref:Uncharacterized protein n=1 Tax=Sphaerosporella brunnea TaxID=1250544 RepID=A0A5J5F7Z3_9PEZI|nr:hypothetical protein FN846DRAFT_201710 [Sphaerosporella brunnea]